MIDKAFWKNKRVFLTGHTGFKGAWLSVWLHSLGAQVTGYALNPPTTPSLFELAKVDSLVDSIIGDIRDSELLIDSMTNADPEIVIHMAAQPLVIESYKNPVETYETNVMGTVNLFEAVKHCKNLKVVINVTTDKCYENNEWVWGYRENEALGGYDPYSSSKACSELVTSAYRNSYYSPNKFSEHGVSIATARAGNVIGGGDWANNRLIPDIIRGLNNQEIITIRNPNAIRPWQHVLEPLGGYIMLAQAMYTQGDQFASAWNFGPREDDAKTVENIVDKLCELWDGSASYVIESDSTQLHEATYLKLDCSKANNVLGWMPKWDIKEALSKILEWNKEFTISGTDVLQVTRKQINEYQND
jgi:CDP-glucose 4,6-dehydratase